MKVDVQDVLFWMDAIRNSDDRYRTLESFWKGQVNSKIWLVDNLEGNVGRENLRIVIHGGWNGVLASLLFNSNLDIAHITSVDIDPACEEIASTVNKRQEMQGRFTAVTANMCNYEYEADIVINTSVEHITSAQYRQWLKHVPGDALIITQSNNYFELDEHINCHNSLEEFVGASQIKKIYMADSLKLPKYTRFMLIGKNNV
jgi:hypothetical protein